MAFKDQSLISSKTVNNNEMLVKVNHLQNLQQVPFTNGVFINLFNSFIKITGIINNTFKPRTQLHPLYFIGSECWIIKYNIKSRKMAAKVKFIRKSLGHNWTLYETNTYVLNKLKITSDIRENKFI